MSEFKGTKGEWVCEEVFTKNGSYFKVTVENGESICNITTRSQERQLANAKLIAAAPELLKRLITLVERMEENDLGNFHSVKMAKEEIKKATE